MIKKILIKKLILSIAVLLSFTGNANAYIDPVTGTFIIQGLIAAFATVMIFFRSLRRKILGLFGIKTREIDLDDDEEENEAADNNDQK